MATRTLLARGEAVYSDVKRRTAGNLTINTTSWIDLDTALDITLTAAGAMGSLTIGAYWDATLTLPGDIAELAVYSRALPLAEQRAVERGFGLKYRISVA